MIPCLNQLGKFYISEEIIELNHIGADMTSSVLGDTLLQKVTQLFNVQPELIRN